MKFVIALVALMTSASAFAGGLTLKQIQNSHGYYFVDAPGTLFEHSNPHAQEAWYQRFLTVDGDANVCITADQKLYGGVVNACVKKVSNGKKSLKCVAREKSALSTAITGTKKVCVQYRDKDSTACVKHQVLSYDHTAKLVARVYVKSLREEDDQLSNKGLVGTIAFKIPACKANPEGQ